MDPASHPADDLRVKLCTVCGVVTSHMYWMQYHRSAISGWQVAEPVTTLGFIESQFNLSWPSWWLADDYSQNYVNDAQDIWTVTHG